VESYLAPTKCSEMSSRKPYKVMNRTRSVKKGVMAANLEKFVGTAGEM